MNLLLRYAQPKRISWFFTLEYRVWSFWSQIGYHGFCMSSCLEFNLEEASIKQSKVLSISSLSIRPLTKAFHNAFNIGQN